MQLRWLSRSITDFDAEFAQTFPEGELFTYEFYGLALENVAETTRHPEDIAVAAREVRAMLPKIDALLTHAPFDQMARSPVRGGDLLLVRRAKPGRVASSPSAVRGSAR